MDGNSRSAFTQEIADAICDHIASGKSLRSFCLQEGSPDKATVIRWLGDPMREAFRDQYARAREIQADSLFDEALDIADTPLIGDKTKTDADGKVIEISKGDMIEHRRLQIDARKWMAGKLRPKKYGDKIDVNHSGAIQRISDEELELRLAQLLGTGGGDPASGGEGAAGSDEQA